MDQINKLKSDLLVELNVHYKNLITFLSNAPINQQFKGNGFLNLDQGVMWFQKGIELIDVETINPPLPNNEEVVDEIKIEAEKLN